jgi:hypothetical protein
MIGGKKLKIVNYILDNVHLSNNTMIATTREIATSKILSVVITVCRLVPVAFAISLVVAIIVLLLKWP